MKKTTMRDWQPKTPGLPHHFRPTSEDLYGECRKAYFKNINLPVLQELYHGDPRHPLSCVITGEVGFSNWEDLLTGKPKQRFDLDFNHIRQRAREGRQSGDSADKWDLSPCSIFRSYSLADSRPDLIEFMCIMPVSKKSHHHISQDSAMGDVILTNYNRKYWPWHLQSRQNFDHIVNKYHLGLDYDWFIDHLSNINHPKINCRKQYS